MKMFEMLRQSQTLSDNKKIWATIIGLPPSGRKVDSRIKDCAIIRVRHGDVMEYYYARTWRGGGAHAQVSVCLLGDVTQAVQLLIAIMSGDIGCVDRWSAWTNASVIRLFA